MLAALFIKHEVKMKRKQHPALSSSMVDLTETWAWGIAIEMRRAKNEDELIKTLGSLKKYEIHFEGNVNAVDRIKELKELYAVMLEKFCGAEIIHS